VGSFEHAEHALLERLLQALAEVMANSPHIEFSKVDTNHQSHLNEATLVQEATPFSSISLLVR
jgi:hypothetical protein